MQEFGFEEATSCVHILGEREREAGVGGGGATNKSVSKISRTCKTLKHGTRGMLLHFPLIISKTPAAFLVQIPLFSCRMHLCFSSFFSPVLISAVNSANIQQTFGPYKFTRLALGKNTHINRTLRNPSSGDLYFQIETTWPHTRPEKHAHTIARTHTHTRVLQIKYQQREGHNKQNSFMDDQFFEMRHTSQQQKTKQTKKKTST